MLRLSILRAGVALLMVCAAGRAMCQRSGTLSAEIDSAAKMLDEDIKACRPIDVSYYSDLQKQSMKSWGLQAMQNSGLLNAGQFSYDVTRAQKLLDRAREAATKQKEACPALQPSGAHG